MANTSNTYKTSTLPVVNSIGANDRVVVLHSPDTAPNTVTIRQSHFISSVANSIVYTYANTTQAGIVKVGNNLSINATYHLNLEDPNFDYILESNTTFYVRTDGNDNNNGLTNDANGAFATLQKACDTMARVNAKGNDVTIQVANGTYEVVPNSSNYEIAHTAIWHQPFNAGFYKILGNEADPDAVVLYNNNAGNYGYATFLIGKSNDWLASSKTRVVVDLIEGFSTKFAVDNGNILADVYNSEITFNKCHCGTQDTINNLWTLVNSNEYSKVWLYRLTVQGDFNGLGSAYSFASLYIDYITLTSSSTLVGTFLTAWEFGSIFFSNYGGTSSYLNCLVGPSSKKYDVKNQGKISSYGFYTSYPGTNPGTLEPLGAIS